MKRSKKIFISVFVILLSGFVVFSIYSSGNDFTHGSIYEYITPKLVTYEPDEAHVRPIGRTVFKDGIRWSSFSGSGIEFNCVATYFDVTIHSDTSRQTYNHRARISVLVNGEVNYENTLSEDEQIIHIDLSEYRGAVNVRIIKLSESMYSSIGIGEIKINEKRRIRPTTYKQLKIEFIGDSITAGYGIDEVRANASFSTETENFSKTYAYLTAEALGAHYSAVAFSGYGVLSGASGGRLNSETTIFKHYEKAITNKKFDDLEEPIIWDNSKFSPDYVVINLGTNDTYYCTTYARRAAFSEEYERLLGLVREKNPNAFIICVLCDVNNSLYPSIKTAIESYKTDTGDMRVTSSILRFDMGNNGIVIQGHPGEEANAAAAEDLIRIIKTIMATGTYDEDEQAETSEEIETFPPFSR